MVNLARSLFIAFFIALNGWLLVAHRYPVTLFGFFMATPLLVAVWQLAPRRAARPAPAEGGIPASLFPYALTLPLAAGIGAVVFFKVRQGDSWFISPFIEKWTFNEAALVLLLSAGLAAASAVIAANNAFLRPPRGAPARASTAALLFQARRSELLRFVIYLYASLWFWGAALAAAAIYDKSRSLDLLFIVCARTSICLAPVVAGALITLRFLPSAFFAGCIAGYSLMLVNSIGAAVTAVFLGTFLGGMGIFLLLAAALIASGTRNAPSA